MQHLLEKKFFPFVIKPGRYIGGEPGQIVKPEDNKFKVALGYPDMYEIGMSYNGLQILYNIINRDNRFLCERFFAPDRDAEEILRREKIPLFSLESFRPLNKFDLLGFTLSYEMVYTNVLNILNLAGIPIRVLERSDDDPLVAAGGPVAHNPEPMAPFIDFFFIGEAEDSLIKLLETLNASKGLSRFERLKRLIEETGSVYVPAFYDEVTHRPKHEFAPGKIKSARTQYLKTEHYPQKPIVPLIETVHDRLTIEIMRGCPRGCRFCQATSIYKPVRIRSQDDIKAQIETQLKQTGYNEVSLLSLSSSDYPDIIPLTISLSRNLQGRRIALSLPSLRPGTFSRKLAEAVKTTRKTGLTFAPESGSERLRQLIRKDITAEELYDTVRLVFENGWHLIKLYFMIGLPTETDDDLDDLIQMIRNVLDIGRRCKGKNIVNVAISPFSPKSHTPFQWDEQPSPEEIERKNDYIRRKIRHPFVNIKLRNPRLSFLEGIIGRGGREMAGVIEEAYLSGARFDGWTEHFNFGFWRRAFEKNNIDPYDYLKGKPFSANLPWSMIELTQSADYLQKERTRSSIDPGGSKKRRESAIRSETENSGANDFGRSPKKMASRSISVPTKNRVRIRWGRQGRVRFLSHLDNGRIFERAIRRCELPIEYSQGFHPHMKLSFGPPLQLGYSSEAEYLDLQLERHFEPSMVDELNAVLPDGYHVIEAASIIDKKISLSAKLNRAVYELTLAQNDSIPDLIDDFLARESVEIERMSKEKIKIVNIRPAVYILKYQSESSENDSARIYMELGLGTAGYVRPSDVIAAARIADDDTIKGLHFHRRELLYIDESGQRLTPMEF